MAWPRMAWRGLDDLPRGAKKKRYAVGPSEGKTKGLPVISASSERMAMVRKLLMKT